MASAEAAKEIRCAQCNESLDIMAPGIRIKGHMKQRSNAEQQFVCGKCASVDARIRRLPGSWTLKALNAYFYRLHESAGYNEQDKFDFYRAAAASVGPRSLQLQVLYALKKHQAKRNVNRNVGESLPSGVWEARGEDVIERHESKVDATQGVLYPINVEQDIDDVAETVEHRLRDLMPKTKCVKETLETLPNMPSADRDAQDPLFKKNDDADVSSSSSSSSSSPDRKKKKTKKETKKMGSGSKSKKQLKKERHAKFAAQKQTDLESQRKAEEKQATADERVQSLMRRKAEKNAAADGKKRKVPTQNAVTKIKVVAAVMLAKLAGPTSYIETFVERGEWERIPRFMKLTVQTTVKELSAMYDEAEGKLRNRVPIPFSFDMSTVNTIVTKSKCIKRTLKELQWGRQTLDRQD